MLAWQDAERWDADRMGTGLIRDIYIYWLVVSNVYFFHLFSIIYGIIFSIIYGMSSFPLTFIFFNMVKTTNR